MVVVLWRRGDKEVDAIVGIVFIVFAVVFSGLLLLEWNDLTGLGRLRGGLYVAYAVPFSLSFFTQEPWFLAVSSVPLAGLIIFFFLDLFGKVKLHKYENS